MKRLSALLRGELFGFVAAFLPQYFCDPHRVAWSAFDYLKCQFTMTASYRDRGFLLEHQEEALELLWWASNEAPLGKAIPR